MDDGLEHHFVFLGVRFQNRMVVVRAAMAIAVLIEEAKRTKEEGMRRPSSHLLALVALPLISGQCFAKGGNMRSEDRYDAQHIESLPAEVRKEVLRLCPAPKALHDFAKYSDHLQKVVLHFEHLYCGEKPFCGPAGCLHQTYVSSSGHYRLVESYYDPN